VFSISLPFKFLRPHSSSASIRFKYGTTNARCNDVKCSAKVANQIDSKKENSMRSLRNQLLTIVTVAIASAYASPIPAVAQTTKVPAASRGAEVEQVSDLQPFTQIAYIPADADLSTIRIDSVKMVKVATKQRSVSNVRDCDDWPGNTADCTRTKYESWVPALRVTYLFKAPSTAADEFGDAYYTFSVYFRPDTVKPGLVRTLSAGKLSRSAAAELFEISTSRPMIQQDVVDEANSTFCQGYYGDSGWVHTNPTCVDKVSYRKVASMSAYISVKVDLAPSSLQTDAD
jgi:hypothetical protein